MRITKQILDGQITLVNRLMVSGNDPDMITEDRWNAIGTVRLYRAYGGVGVHQVMNDGGGVTTLFPISTSRETYNFLQGLITGLRFAPPE